MDVTPDIAELSPLGEELSTEYAPAASESLDPVIERGAQFGQGEDFAVGTIDMPPELMADRELEAVSEALPLYLQEIGRVTLLTAQQEVELAKAMEAGHEAARRLRAGEEVSEEERGALEDAVAKGKAARRTLVESNLRLVVSVARRYMNRGIPLSDLIQEGNMGLLRAVEKFDYHRGFKFSTYATWWIRQAVTRAIADHARTIRIPVHMVETINRMVRVQSRLQQQCGRDPTAREIAEAMDLPEEKVREIMRILPQPISLETPVGDEQDAFLGDFVEDKVGEDLEDAASRALLKDQMASALDSLTARERKVLQLRFGMENGKYHTLAEIGDRLGVTRERIRQIEGKALRKLRHPSRSKKLRAYAE